MANDPQKRALLDQLTSAATSPQPVPAPLAPAADSTTPTADASASTPGSIANLEDRASSPESLSAASDAAKATDEQEHPSFLTKLKNFAGGAFGVESPDENSAASAGAKTMGVLGRIGTGLAEAAGTPEQKQIAQENSQTPLKLAQIENERLYRDALIGTKSNANDINQQKADQQRQAADARMRLKGYVPDEQSPGAYRVMDEDEILADPILKQNQGLQQAATASKAANAALAMARRDALLNPDNPTLKLKAQQIENTYKLAQAHLGMQLHNIGRQDQEFLYNYGQTPGTSPTGSPQASGAEPVQANGVTPTQEAAVAGSPGGLTLRNAPDSMLVDPRTGIPIPLKMLSTLKPTPDEQKRADFAMSAIHSAQILEEMVKQAQAKVGPITGRVAELMSRAGLGNKFNQELQNYVRFSQSAATAAHTGRFSVPILDKMDKMIGPQMNLDQFLGGTESVQNQMGPYADAGWKPTAAEYRDALTNGQPLKAPSGKSVEVNPAAGNKLTPAEYLKHKKQKAAGGK